MFFDESTMSQYMLQHILFCMWPSISHEFSALIKALKNPHDPFFPNMPQSSVSYALQCIFSFANIHGNLLKKNGFNIKMYAQHVWAMGIDVHYNAHQWMQ